VNQSPRDVVALLPLFRSQAQYRLVGELFTDPGGEFSIGDLAGRISASHATVSREVARLTDAGLLRSRDEGRRRLVSARSDTPVFGPLRALMSRVYGVPAVVAQEFADGDVDVFIFGSYAARWLGHQGSMPNDVDVLVVGELDPTDAWEAAARASQRLGIEVNVVARTRSEWESETTGFASQIRSQPLLHVRTPSGELPLRGANVSEAVSDEL
jgi:DNA-binding transcriptional ArsR family regulator